MIMETRLFIGGQWVSGGKPFEVINKYNQQIIGTAPQARLEDVDAAVRAARQASEIMADLPAYRRAEILSRTAEKIQEKKEEIAHLIAAESGKALKFSRAEVDRAVQVFQLATEEAKRIHGETLPLDAVPYGQGYWGFWQRRPVGVVAAITPFNFPLNLVAHKVAPALAAGNALILKPAEQTPLTAVMLVKILEEAGVPEGGVNLLQGPGEIVGDALVRHSLVDKISFTGSREVGQLILSRAGIKKVTLELGNTSPVIVAADVDLDFVAQRCALGAFYNAGQVCISVQRIYSAQTIYEPLLEKLVQATQKMVVGDPLEEKTDVGPMIDAQSAQRVESWVQEAHQGGAQIIIGGKREGSLYWPTLLTQVKPEMKVMAQEVFAPVASVVSCESFAEALQMANATEYGLQAAVFTNDINSMLKAIKRLNFGGVIINDSPAFRADHMPYGGNRQSGLGREGVKFAIEEMTNIQMVVIRAG